MDIFGDDSDSEDNNNLQEDISLQGYLNPREKELVNALFVNTTKAKAIITKNANSDHDSTEFAKKKLISIRYCLVLVSDVTLKSSTIADSLIKRFLNDLKIPKESISTLELKQLQHSSLKYSSIGIDVYENFDIVVLLDDLNQILDSPKYITAQTIGSGQKKEVQIEDFIYSIISPGGFFVTFQQKQGPNDSKEFNRLFQYFIPSGEDVGSNVAVLKSTIRKRRSVLSNPFGAAYWEEAQLESTLRQETERIQSLCVEVSAHERLSGSFSAATHAKAVDCLREHGMCIIPQLFDPEEVLAWGRAAKEDLRQVVQALWRSRAIDLLHPYTSSDSADSSAGPPFIENFHEMSTREALRCDLRNGLEVRLQTQRLYGPAAAGSQPLDALALRTAVDELSRRERVPPPCNLRYHPGLLQVLSQVMNEPADGVEGGPDPGDSSGNWGLWNFGGEGPDEWPAPVVGQVGAVMGLPGCADQTIHADTAHVFTHTAHLPPHYLNLFLPAVAPAVPDTSGQSLQDWLRMGQTAFVLGSHRLRVSAAVMTRRDGQQQLVQRLVRPHLQAGDALLFDCRILHFGLANQHLNRHLREEQGQRDPNQRPRHPLDAESDHFWRPLLYINYHQSWFRDPKNWNEATKLLP